MESKQDIQQNDRPSAAKEPAAVRNGVPVLPSRGETVTLEMVQEIMDKVGV